VRSLSDERVAMINLLSLGRGNKPAVQFFAAGSTPPKAGGELPLADTLAPAIGDAAVMVVNPADNTVYYYMEGMNAPMGSYQSYGASARAVSVIDRSLKETEPGVYTSKVRIPVAGRYDVAFLLEQPRLVNCFSLEAKEDPLLASQRKRIVVEYLVKSREVPLGKSRAGALHGEDRGRRAADRAEGPARAVVPRARTAPQRDHRARGAARRVRGAGAIPGARAPTRSTSPPSSCKRSSRTWRTSPCARRARPRRGDEAPHEGGEAVRTSLVHLAVGMDALLCRARPRCGAITTPRKPWRPPRRRWRSAKRRSSTRAEGAYGSHRT
jgi:hypothetical protein